MGVVCVVGVVTVADDDVVTVNTFELDMLLCVPATVCRSSSLMICSCRDGVCLRLYLWFISRESTKWRRD